MKPSSKESTNQPPLDAWLPFSGPVAGYNDYLVRAREEAQNRTLLAASVDRIAGTKIKHIGQNILSRTVATLVFPVAASLDLLANMVRAPLERIEALFSANKERSDAHKLRAQKCVEDVKSCLRAVVTSPAGLFSADIVTRHFVPKTERKGIIEAGGKYHSAKGQEIFPSSVEEIQEILRKANRDREKICVIGAHFSQNKSYLSDFPHTRTLNLSRFNQVDIFQEEGKSYARVGAGASWGQIQDVADEQGLSIKVMQASNPFSAGGSLSVNCHGWDIETGTLSETVRSLTIVNAQGEVEKLQKGDEKLKGILGGYGFLGVIVEAELELTDNQKLYSWGEEVKIENYVEYFEKEILPRSGEHKLHLFRLSLDPDHLIEEGVATTFSTRPPQARTAIPKEAVGSSPVLEQETPHGSLLDRIMIHVARRFALSRKLYWKMEKKNMLTEGSLMRNQAMRPPINAAFNYSRADAEWLQEYFVPGEALANILEKLGALLKANKVKLLNASVRFVKADVNTALPYAKQDRYAIVLFFNQSLAPEEIEKTKTWVKTMIDHVNQVGGSFYLPYQHFADRDQFEAAYGKENIQNFVELKKKYDPDGIFTNGIYTDYLEPIEEIEKREKERQVELAQRLEMFREIYRDEEKIETFNLFLKNVFMIVDPKVFTPIVKRLLEESTSFEVFYNKLLSEIGQAKGHALQNLRTQLKSLDILQQTFADQTESLLGGKGHIIEGYAEIGYTGRLMKAYQDRSRFVFKGPSYVINDRPESAMDLIECGFPRPYQQFIDLKAYAPLTDSIAANSLEMVTCPIGLHHCPKEQLDVFVRSIAEVLKEGGSFILRDHDAQGVTLPIATLAHTVFNAGSATTWEDEAHEVRNFQPVSYWRELLESHGFELVQEPIVTALGDKEKEDTSHNALMRFVKKTARLEPTVVSEVERLHLKAKLSDPTYQKKANQTYQTAAEWEMVSQAKEQAEFLETKPRHQFPFLRSLWNVEKTAVQSMKEAVEHTDLSTTARSDYTTMTLFMAVTQLVENVGLKIIQAPLVLSSGVEKRAIHQVVKETAQEYAAFINHTPFYEFPFFQKIKPLWQAVPHEGLSSIFSNSYIAFIHTIELIGKGILAYPARSSTEGSYSTQIYAIVEDPQNKLTEKWASCRLFYHPLDVKLEHPARPEIIEAAPHGVKLIRMPRYRPFNELIQECIYDGVKIHKIGGQEKIQVKIKVNRQDEAQFRSLEHARYLGNISILSPRETDQEYIRLDVDITHLHEVLPGIINRGGEIEYIHDF